MVTFIVNNYLFLISQKLASAPLNIIRDNMNLDDFEEMDSIILLSIINMKLRDEFNGDLDKLVKTYAIDRNSLEKKLATSELTFKPTIGSFCSCKL